MEASRTEPRTTEIPNAAEAASRRGAKTHAAEVSGATKVRTAEVSTSTAKMPATAAAMAATTAAGQCGADCETAETYQRDYDEQNSEDTTHRTLSGLQAVQPPY
jgi:hypothetical protein